MLPLRPRNLSVQFFQSDGDGVFTSKETEAILRKGKIRHLKGAPHDSNTNPFIERVRRTIFEGTATSLIRSGARDRKSLIVPSLGLHPFLTVSHIHQHLRVCMTTQRLLVERTSSVLCISCVLVCASCLRYSVHIDVSQAQQVKE